MSNISNVTIVQQQGESLDSLLDRVQKQVMEQAISMAREDDETYLIGVWQEADSLQYCVVAEQGVSARSIHFTPQVRVFSTGFSELITHKIQ